MRDAPAIVARDDTTPAIAGLPPSASPRRIASSHLLGADNEVEIEHDGQIYRLRKTAQGKLILTK